MAERTEAEQAGRGLVAAIVRTGETKAHLELALRELHTAMAITPLDMGHVTVMGDLAKGIVAQITEHDELIEEFAQNVAVRVTEKPEEGAA